jgi:hypothetical protein
MSASQNDRQVLRELAAKVAQIAAMPVQRERTALIKSLNELKPLRPVVLAIPEGGWVDLIKPDDLHCQDPFLRDWEAGLRRRIFTHEKIGDDQPVTDLFRIGVVADMGNYGFDVQWQRGENRGSGKWEPPLRTLEDFKKLRPRNIRIDHRETQRRVNLANEIFGDILRVRQFGQFWWTTSPTNQLALLRGLDQLMLDMYDNPQFLHDLLAFLRDNILRDARFLQDQGVLSLNNDGDVYVGSGALGVTDQLPAPGHDGHVRMKDMWCLSEAQEFVGVGPELFEEFALRYQLPIVSEFGLVCYGCCEPLDKKFDLVTKNIPNLRRVSVSPWCDRQIAADKLTNKYVYSWKPAPSMICTPTVDWNEVRKLIRETLSIAQGCCVEMVMKDTHTFAGDPTRIGKWTTIAKEEVLAAG